MNKKLLALLLALPVIYFIGWIGYLKISELNAPQVKVAVRGYDPRDLLSGHYLNLQTDWNRTDCRQFEENICPKERFEYVYRYYVPEHDALKLEKLMFRENVQAELLFVLPDGAAPRIKGFLINGRPWAKALGTEN